MPKIMKSMALVMLATLALTGAGSLALADHHEEQQIYVWISGVLAQPGQSEALIGLLMEDAQYYDPLVDSGAAADWGIAIPIVHDGSAPGLHYEWVSFIGWAAADQFMQSFMERRQALSDEEKAEMMAEWQAAVVPGSHFDMVNHSAHIGSPTPNPGHSGYIHLSYFEARRGKWREATETYKEQVAPVYDQLLADGKILNYGLHRPAIHQGEDWTHMDWALTENLAARDDIDAAFEADDATRSEEENKARMEHFMELFEETHSDQILLVVHHKTPGGDEE